MNYSKQYINEISENTGFISSNIEKVLRLLDVLNYIFSNSSFKDALSLKGGTAINLIHTNLKRLSVDIDLDYHRYIDKDKAAEDRKAIIKELDNYMSSEGYEISDKTRESVILASRMYSYRNSSGNKDNIKVEINFINRISLYPTITKKISFFDKTANIVSPLKEELYGMKIAALIDRSKPRDLYDVDCFFENNNSVDLNILRKTTIFYLSLDGIYEINNKLFNGIKAIDQSSIKKELMPVLKKGESFLLNESQERVLHHLSTLLSLGDNEAAYLREFSKGNYKPKLLLEDRFAEIAENHPMARWRCINGKH